MDKSLPLRLPTQQQPGSSLSTSPEDNHSMLVTSESARSLDSDLIGQSSTSCLLAGSIRRAPFSHVIITKYSFKFLLSNFLTGSEF